MARAIAITAPRTSPLEAAAGSIRRLGDRSGEAVRAAAAAARGAGRKAISAIVSAEASDAPRTAVNDASIQASRPAGTPDRWTDEHLLVAHRTGDARALRVLMKRYRGELHGFLTRLLGSQTSADDVFQEAFLQVHLSADAFDEERRFKPWLYTIAANKGRDFLRRQRRRSAASLDAPVGENGDGSLVDLLPGAEGAPSASLESADDAAMVKAVVDEMPSHFREILLLAYFQKLSYAQISDSLSIPIGTVKSRLHAAVAHFASSWRLQCARRGVEVEGEDGGRRADRSRGDVTDDNGSTK